MISKNILNIIFLVGVIVITSVTATILIGADKKYIEKYADNNQDKKDKKDKNKDNNNKTSISNKYTNNKTLAYFKYLKSFVLSCDNYEYSNRLMVFLPTYTDSWCKWESTKLDGCNNMFINNISFPEQYNYNSSIICNSIDTTIGTEKDQSLIRVLNNIYSLRKQCIRFSTQYMDQTQLNSLFYNTNFSSIMIIDIWEGNDEYKLQLWGKLDLFVLLRPTIISFNEYGLFSIKNKRGSVFDSYSTIQPEPWYLYLSKVQNYTDDENNNVIIQSLDNKHLMDLLNDRDVNKVLLSTIYYLHFEETKSYSESLNNKEYVHNTFTFIFDNKYIDSLMTKTQNSSTFNFNNKSTTNVCNSISYTIDLSSGQPFFSLTVNNISSSDPIVCDVHKDFTKLIHSLPERLNTPFINNGMVSYTIIVTCTMDIVNIVAMLKLKDKSVFFFNQYNLINPYSFYIQYWAKNDELVSDDSILKYHNTNFDIICPTTSIPNYAYLAKQLGYNFS